MRERRAPEKIERERDVPESQDFQRYRKENGRRNDGTEAPRRAQARAWLKSCAWVITQAQHARWLRRSPRRSQTSAFYNYGRTWKPNVQEKRLFSYIIDRHNRVKVATHALRCIDKAGGIDEYLLKTPYHKMDTEMGLYWKTKIQKMYEDLGEMELVFFSPEDEANIEQQFKELKIEERATRREASRKMYGWAAKEEQTNDKSDFGDTSEEASKSNEGSLHTDFHERMIAIA